jgi:hypothetical protein
MEEKSEKGNTTKLYYLPRLRLKLTFPVIWKNDRRYYRDSFNLFYTRIIQLCRRVHTLHSSKYLHKTEIYT